MLGLQSLEYMQLVMDVNGQLEILVLRRGYFQKYSYVQKKYLRF